MWAKPANDEPVARSHEDRARLRDVLGFPEPEASSITSRGRKRIITPAHDIDDHDDWGSEHDDEAVVYETVGGGSLFELTTSLQTLVEDLTRGMATVSERLAALEERIDPTPVTEALHDLGRELARGESSANERLTAIEQRPDTSNALLTSMHGLSGDLARWSVAVADRLTALEQRPDHTDRLRTSVEHLAGSMLKVSERLALLEMQRTDPIEHLALIEQKLDKLLAAPSPRDVVAGIRNETAAVHDDIEGMRGDIRRINTRMQKLVEALFGGAPS